MIRIMLVLCTGNNCVANVNFPLSMFQTDNKGMLLLMIGETGASCYNFHSKSLFHKNMQSRDYWKVIDLIINRNSSISFSCTIS